MNRRSFLRQAGLALGVPAVHAAGSGTQIIIDPNDPIASSAPVRWAAGELEGALKVRPAATRILIRGRAAGPPETLGIQPSGDGLVVSGGDTRGLVYAVLEAADRARHGADLARPVSERPANAIRSISRCFESDIEDKSWFHDRDFWRGYLTMLAAHRYNRFSLTLGLGYNSPHRVTDAYFYFAYPFLLAVPGYNVRAVPLADKERDRNLETLRYISEETAARGLQFQLGLWTHAYEWIDSPNPNYTISGLTPANHAAYCRDALTALLRACPAISGVTFRIHGESGIPEGSYDFWRTLFDGVARSGRRVEIDMHAKGMDQKTIDIALATGMPINISPKYWAEHMGMPYHQASIRELEMPPRAPVTSGPYTLSSGSRRFLRYGYGDLLREDRRFGILHRIWPGTQRVLLWGDPAFAAGYGRASSFCGSAGVELMEPLSFKGRIGSGLPGGRCAYADSSLNPKYDYEKYLYQYRVWGRLIYNPEADPEGWRRQLRHDFGVAAQPAEQALASASRILPIVTTTHGASGSNNAYWPEIYTNMPIVDAGRKHPYGDTPAPKRFGTVSSFDPELFTRIDDFAADLLAGHVSAKYSPVEVAQWLEDLADEAERNLSRIAAPKSPELRRLAADAAIQSGLGRFFAYKMRSAVLWSIYQRTGDDTARAEALKQYRAARKAWAGLAAAAKDVYMPDISYGPQPYLRGHWLDRVAAIDEDIADMERAKAAAGEPAGKSVAAVLGRPSRPVPACRHMPPANFRPGEPLEIALSFSKGDGRQVALHYRRVNQAEAWQSAGMSWRDQAWRAAIPAGYTRSPYPLQYYFEIGESGGRTIYPGFNPNLANQPYFAVRQTSAA
jgi:hypothetical protein